VCLLCILHVGNITHTLSSFFFLSSFILIQYTCSGTGHHSVKAWSNEMCDSDVQPFYQDSGDSDVCINTRDGNSIYYDCSKSAETPTDMSLSTGTHIMESTTFTIVLILCILAVWLAQ
jgi:hypothetical protein